MITGLDDPAAVDPSRVGAKAAALALARQGGLPVLPGFVVDTSPSRGHMALGSSQLAVRGSGGARLAMTSEAIPGAARIVAAGRALSSVLAARSSSPIEMGGEWAGTFTSYTGITPEELPKAVAGCWASAFSVDALDRQRQRGIEPGSMPMAVLVQPEIDPVVGGVAEISRDGTLRVEAVAGSPAPLLQGWERGATAIRRGGAGWEGAEAIALIGMAILDELATALDAAFVRYGYGRSEWGVAESLWILQLGNVTRPLFSHDAWPTAAPGRIAAGVWDLRAAAVVLEGGAKIQGVPAAPGIGVGFRHHSDGADGNGPPRRAVVTAPVARPGLSQLIWDAAGLVTDRGSPGAHVFEAARSLGVPAVCGVDLGPEFDQIVAVDGYSGLVATLPLRAQPIP